MSGRRTKAARRRLNAGEGRSGPDADAARRKLAKDLRVSVRWLGRQFRRRYWDRVHGRRR